MIDVVTIMRDAAEAQGFEFHYGDKNVLNLLNSDLDTEKIYFLLLSPIKQRREESSWGNGKASAKGSFMLVQKSNLDNTVYREKGQDETTGKYELHIKPMYAALDLFDDSMNCGPMTYRREDAIDAYNLFDFNVDGLIIETFTLQE